MELEVPDVRVIASAVETGSTAKGAYSRVVKYDWHKSEMCAFRYLNRLMDYAREVLRQLPEENAARLRDYFFRQPRRRSSSRGTDKRQA